MWSRPFVYWIQDIRRRSGATREGSRAADHKIGTDGLQACHAGSATIHANSAAEAFQRLEDLIAEVAAAAPTRTIQQAVDVVVYIRRTAEGRKVEEIFVPQALRAWETSKAGRAV